MNEVNTLNEELDVLIQCEWDVHYPHISGRIEYTDEEVKEMINAKILRKIQSIKANDKSSEMA